MTSEAGTLTATQAAAPLDAAEAPEAEAPEASAGADAGSRAAERLLAALPAGVRDGLTAEQRDALLSAARELAWSKHATDIRLSIPFIGKRYYLVLLGGEERRDAARLRRERGKHPLATLTNIVFLGLFSTCCTFFGGFLFTLVLVWYLSL